MTVSIKKAIFSLAITLITLAPLKGFGQRVSISGTGNGGTTEASEFKELAIELATHFHLVANRLPVVSATLLSNTALTARVFMVDAQPRDVFNNPATCVYVSVELSQLQNLATGIYCWADWWRQHREPEERKRQVLHEITRAMGLNDDGYAISVSILRVIRDCGRTFPLINPRCVDPNSIQEGRRTNTWDGGRSQVQANSSDDYTFRGNNISIGVGTIGSRAEGSVGPTLSSHHYAGFTAAEGLFAGSVIANLRAGLGINNGTLPVLHASVSGNVMAAYVPGVFAAVDVSTYRDNVSTILRTGFAPSGLISLGGTDFLLLRVEALAVRINGNMNMGSGAVAGSVSVSHGLRALLRVSRFLLDTGAEVHHQGNARPNIVGGSGLVRLQIPTSFIVPNDHVSIQADANFSTLESAPGARSLTELTYMGSVEYGLHF